MELHLLQDIRELHLLQEIMELHLLQEIVELHLLQDIREQLKLEIQRVLLLHGVIKEKQRE